MSASFSRRSVGGLTFVSPRPAIDAPRRRSSVPLLPLYAHLSLCSLLQIDTAAQHWCDVSFHELMFSCTIDVCHGAVTIVLGKAVSVTSLRSCSAAAAAVATAFRRVPLFHFVCLLVSDRDGAAEGRTETAIYLFI